MELRGILDFLYAKKAWVGAAIAAVGEVVSLFQVVTADEAITLDEAKGLWLAITAAATVILTGLGVFSARNASTPRT